MRKSHGAAVAVKSCCCGMQLDMRVMGASDGFSEGADAQDSW